MRKNLIVLFLVIAGKLFFVDSLSAQVTRLSATKIQVQNFCIQFTPGSVTVGINYFSAGIWTPDPTNVYTYNSVTATLSGSTATFEFAGSTPVNGAPAVNFPAALQQGNIKLNGMNFFWPGNNCVPLPIFLNYFRANLTAGNQYAQCTWETSMEQNVDHWELQWSTDAVGFTTVVVEDAVGNSQTTSDYSVIANVKPGQNYFRVLFFDGITTLNNSPVVALNVPAGTYPTDVCGYQTITSGPNPLCPGAAGVYKLHNASPNTVWSVSPSSNPIGSTNAGTVGHLTNTAYSTGYTGTTVLTTTSGGCVKNVQLLSAAPVSNITINGPATICTGSQSYSLSSTTGISSINWASSSPTIAYVSPNGGTTLLTRAGTLSGYVNLSANYYVNDNVSGCAFPIVKTNSIAVGSIIHFTYNITGSSSTQYKQLTANCDVVNGATSYLWTLNLGSKGTTTYPSRSMSASLPPCSGGALTINVNSTCGSAQDGVTVYNSTCGSSFAVSPNPAKSSLTITTLAPQESINAASADQLNNHSTTTTSVINNITKVEIYNKSGRLVFVKKFAGNQKQINLSLPSLAPDNYVIQIYSNSGKEAQQLQILQ